MKSQQVRRKVGAASVVILVALVVAMCWPQGIHRVQAQSSDLTLSPSSGPPGTTITITPAPGQTYTTVQGSTINAYYLNTCGSGNIQQGTQPATVGSNGTIPTMTLTILSTETAPCSEVFVFVSTGPDPQSGLIAYAIFTLTGTSGTGSSVTPTATATVTPSNGATVLSVTPSTVAPGSSFTVSGSNLPSGATSVDLLLTGNGTTTTLNAALPVQNGSFSSSFTAPSTTGTYTVQALAFGGLPIASTQLTVSQGGGPQGATLTVSPLFVSPGQSVTVTGSGFSPSGQVTINSPFGSSTVQADPSGAFTTSLGVPSSVTGSTVTITASDNNGRTATATISLNNGQSATLAVSPNTAGPGQSVSVTGTHFAAGEQVTLALASPSAPTNIINGTTQPVTADGAGNLNATYAVPSVTSGSYLVIALGQSSNQTASAPFTVQGIVTVTPSATATSGIVPFTTETPVPYVPPTATATATPRIVLPTATATPPAVATEATYFAEGYTGQEATNGRATFQESLYLFNTLAAPTNVTVTYYVAVGSASRVVLRSIHLAARGTSMRSVNADVGNDQLVSIAVGHVPGVTARIVIARTGPKGVALDAASSNGSTQAATSWSFAEGYAGVTFQEYLSLFNPGSAPAHVQIHFLPTSGAPPAPLTATVPAAGRQSVNVSGLYLLRAGIHAPKSIALVVTSDQPIVADRTLYWGEGGGSGKYGYDITPGAPGGATTLVFAALARTGAEPAYITVLNPNAARVSLQIVFRSASGQVLVSYTNAVAPLARLTVSIRSVVPKYTGIVSATLNATGPVVAEAPLYFGGSPNVGRHAGLSVLGTSSGTGAAVAGMDAKDATLYIYNPANSTLHVTGQVGSAIGSAGTGTLTVPPLSITIASLPAGSGPRGLLLSADAPFVAELINGNDTTTAAWGGTLLPPH